MQHGAVILLVVNNTVDNDEGLCIGVDGVEAIHQHHAADTWCATSCDGMHLRTKAFLDFLINADRIGILKSLCAVDSVDIRAR